MLQEANYPPVVYFPRRDVEMDYLVRTDHATHCPYKGDASYWSALPAGETGKDAMWAYQQPFDEMAEIRDHGAFYANRVTIEATPG